MLDEFTVRNLGLLPHAHVRPGQGLIVITGETGTGKTLLLGALRLLRGEQARKDQIGPHGDDTVVEGRFVDDTDELVMSRRVDRTRSRATMNGSMATAGSLASALDGVLDVVGQHDRSMLSKPGAVRTLVDGALDERGKAHLAAYREAWSTLSAVEADAASLGGDSHALERELAMVRFQSKEIRDAGFDTGDDEKIAARAARLRNAQELQERLSEVARAAGETGAAGSLHAVARALGAAVRVDGSLTPLVEMSHHIAEMLSDFNSEIVAVVNELDHDPGDLDAVEARLALLGDLRRKYGPDLDAILLFAEEAEARAEELELLLGRAGEIDADVARARTEVATRAGELHRSRAQSAALISQAAEGHLRDLGFEEPVVRVAIANREPGPEGTDRVVVEFASDSALEPRPVSNIASGGELSRLTLALRLAAGANDVDIIAFDEIDAGVGGETALAMGRKLRALAGDRQVFCVTHLPQVAAFADRHFVVRREGNVASIERVENNGRLEELSRMLAGLPDSQRGKDHAAELLALASTS